MLVFQNLYGIIDVDVTDNVSYFQNRHIEQSLAHSNIRITGTYPQADGRVEQAVPAVTERMSARLPVYFVLGASSNRCYGESEVSEALDVTRFELLHQIKVVFFRVAVIPTA